MRVSRRWSACERKKKYPHALAAGRAIERMRNYYGVDIGNPYFCEYGPHWHTGHHHEGDTYLERRTQAGEDHATGVGWKIQDDASG